MRAAIAKVEGELGVGIPENAGPRPSPKPRPRVNITRVRLAAAVWHPMYMFKGITVFKRSCSELRRGFPYSFEYFEDPKIQFSPVTQPGLHSTRPAPFPYPCGCLVISISLWPGGACINNSLPSFVLNRQNDAAVSGIEEESPGEPRLGRVVSRRLTTRERKYGTGVLKLNAAHSHLVQSSATSSNIISTSLTRLARARGGFNSRYVQMPRATWIEVLWRAEIKQLYFSFKRCPTLVFFPSCRDQGQGYIRRGACGNQPHLWFLYCWPPSRALIGRNDCQERERPHRVG
jgi:hypothetical protein